MLELGLGLALVAIVSLAWIRWASKSLLEPSETTSVTPYGPAYASPRETLTVMAYNIGYLSGMTNNEPVRRPRSLFEENLDAVVQLIRDADPDIIGFQEIDFGCPRSYGFHQLNVLADRLRYPVGAGAVNWDKRYVPFPYGSPTVHFGRVLSGQAILSRYPIAHYARHELQRPAYPRWYDLFYLDRLAQVARIEVGEQPLVIINVHMEAFDPSTREAQAEEVRDLYEQHAAEAPTLVIGDFNAPMPAEKPALGIKEREQYEADETIHRLTRDTTLREAFPDTAYTDAPAAIGTYPAAVPRMKIDHIFYPDDQIERVSADVIGGGTNPPSDHRAVVMRFQVRS